MSGEVLKRNRCGNEPWPCYRPDCSDPACESHRRQFPNCLGYACNCPDRPLPEKRHNDGDADGR